MYRKTHRKLMPVAVAVSGASLALILPASSWASDSSEVSQDVQEAAHSVKEKAGDVAETVSDAATDLKLHTLLEAKLAESDSLSALSINTDVEARVASLSGQVETEAQKTLATRLAMSVDGIRAVRNDLEVTAPEPGMGDKIMGQASDAAITAAVKSRLLVSQHTSGLDIDVDTDNDVVSLTGTVDSGAERELAGLIAANTTGVAAVDNELTVANN